MEQMHQRAAAALKIADRIATATAKRGLGPNQLKWLRDNVPHFAVLEQQATAAIAEREQARKEIGANA